MTTPTEKVCSKCGETKPLTEYHRSKKSRDGYRGHCKSCQREVHAKWYAANKDRRVDTNRKWRETNPDRYRDSWLRRLYGIGIDEYNAMVERAGGVCEICLASPAERGHRIERLVVDHDHTTGRVRGVLCSACNKSLGQIGDANLAAAAAYILRVEAVAA